MKHGGLSPRARRRRNIILISAGGALLLFGLIYYVRGTPAYSLFKLYRAYKSHDVRGALKYIDVQAVLEHSVDRVRNELGADGTGGRVSGGEASREEFIEALRPLLRERIRERLIGSVVGSEYGGVLAQSSGSEYVSDDLGSQVGGRMFNIEKKDGEAVLTLESGVRIGLRQTRDRYWRVVSIEGLIRLTEEEKALIRARHEQPALRDRILDRVQF